MPVHLSLLQMPVHPSLLQMPALVPEKLECLCFSSFIILVVYLTFVYFLQVQIRASVSAYHLALCLLFLFRMSLRDLDDHGGEPLLMAHTICRSSLSSCHRFHVVQRSHCLLTRSCTSERASSSAPRHVLSTLLVSQSMRSALPQQ